MKTLRLVLVAVALAMTSGAAKADTLTNLYNFGGADGANPFAGLIQGTDGKFYGTTYSGGTNGGFGTMFRFSSAGALSTLYSFSMVSGPKPLPGVLTQGSDGNFYGTTEAGGTNFNGTIFSVTSAGTLSTLYQFGGTNGTRPMAGLVQGNDGGFYGTTFAGGTDTNCAGGCGTVFKISSAGTLTTLYRFGGGSDGGQPQARLIQGSDGEFYGTTTSGGTNLQGTVFKMTSAGTLTTLYQFGGVNGSGPTAGLVQGTDGLFYGTTHTGGTTTNGTVFKITSAGTFTSLYSFTGGTNGSAPDSELVLGSDGNFYGTTINSNNVAVGPGTVYRISAAGAFTKLYTFGGGADGSIPSKLVQGVDGNFYGTTFSGGTNVSFPYGIVFELLVPLSPPPNQINAFQAGANLIFGVPSVEGETYQLQYRDSLTSGNWSNVTSACVSNSLGGPFALTNVAGTLPPQQFYRFAITP
jgi:uncharacterized repeat protein (TIGR03803 family)